MRKVILMVVIFLQTAFWGFAQTTLDFPDYRSKRDNFSKVTDPAIHNDLVFFTLAGLDLRVGKPLATGLPLTSYGPNDLHFEGNNVHVIMTTGPFDKTKHKLSFIDKHLVRIDNHPYFGNYGDVPSGIIVSVILIQDKDTVVVPPTAFADLFEPLLMYTEGGKSKTHDGVYLSTDQHTVYIYMLNKEVGGYYEVTWVIRDKKYLRRVVDAGI